MNKAELIESVSAATGKTKREVTDVVESMLHHTKHALSKGEKVALSGFGVFEVSNRKARTGRNPRTGEAVKIKATKHPKFRPGAEFKSVVSGATKIAAPKAAKTAAPAAPAKKAAAKKAAPVKKAAPARKAAPAKKAPAKKAAPVRKAAVKKAPAKKAPARKAAAKR